MELLRDSIAGQLIRYATSNRYLLYPEEENGFVFKSMVMKRIQNYDSSHVLIDLPIGDTGRRERSTFR